LEDGEWDDLAKAVMIGENCFPNNLKILDIIIWSNEVSDPCLRAIKHIIAYSPLLKSCDVFFHDYVGGAEIFELIRLIPSDRDWKIPEKIKPPRPAQATEFYQVLCLIISISVLFVIHCYLYYS